MVRSTTLPNLRSHRWKVLGVGVAANASFSAAFSGIPTTAVFIRSGYHLGNAQLGLVLGLMALGIALSELPWGMLTDRWGDRPVLLTGLGTTALALCAMALFAAPSRSYVPGLPVLAAGLLVVGILGGSVNGSSGRAVMSWFADGERGLAMSIRQTAMPLGGALGALILPTLAEHFGFAAVFSLLGLFCGIALFFTWLWLFEPPLVTRARTARTFDTAGEKSLNRANSVANSPLRNRQIWRVVAAISLLCGPQFAVIAFGTVFLHDFSHAGTAATTAAMVTLQCGSIVVRVWSGRKTDLNGNRRGFIRLCALLSAAAFATLAALVAVTARYPMTSQAMPTLLIVTFVVTGICISAWNGIGYTELATLAGPHNAGTALGMGNTCVFVMNFLTPLAIPHIVALGNWTGVWLAASCCAIIAQQLFPKPLQRAYRSMEPLRFELEQDPKP